MNNISISPGKNNVGAYINNLDLNNLKENQTKEIKNILCSKNFKSIFD